MALPADRSQRVATEIMASFLENSGEQLVALLKGRAISTPLHQLEVLVSLFYSSIEDAYIGVDSHPPSRFLDVHPFLLESLAAADGSDDDERAAFEHHDECHAARHVRIVSLSPEGLQNDFDQFPDVATDYFTQHDEHGIKLLSVDPAVHRKTRNEVLRGEWTGDLGLWLNTGALLFQPSIEAANKDLRLELLYPGVKRFSRCLQYVARLIENASLVWLEGEKVISEALNPEFQHHLLWSLDTMFEPGLADVWDEFVAAPKRIHGLGPFVKRHIEERMGSGPVKILDAATGTGCESIYLVKEGHDVTSNEIEHRLIQHAKECAEDAGVTLRITRFDWRHFEHLAPPETYDIVLALGNSMSCLPTAADVRIVLARFAHLLRPYGLLIVDERNYPMMFKYRRQMGRPDFRIPANVVYCSESIQARPFRIPKEPGVDRQFLTLEYVRASDSKPVGQFKVLPFDDKQLEQLLEASGFRSVSRFYNLQEPNGNRDTAEFVTYLASRSFVESSLTSGTDVDVVVAFLDITGSVAAKRMMGEAHYNREWKRHEQRATAVIAEHGGTLVNTTGDGFLVAFDSPVAAVHCMVSIVRDPGTDKLRVRAGVNMGLVLQDDDGNLRGSEVDIAARICDQARPDLLMVDDRIALAVQSDMWQSVGTVDLPGADARQLWRWAD